MMRIPGKITRKMLFAGLIAVFSLFAGSSMALVQDIGEGGMAFFVAPGGDDMNPGTAEHPLAALNGDATWIEKAKLSDDVLKAFDKEVKQNMNR